MRRASECPGSTTVKMDFKDLWPFLRLAWSGSANWLAIMTFLPCLFLYPGIQSVALGAKLWQIFRVGNTQKPNRKKNWWIDYFQFANLVPAPNGAHWSSSVKLMKLQQLKQASRLSGSVRLQTRLQTAAAAARAPTRSTQQSPKHQIPTKILANFESFILWWVSLTF